MAQSRSPEPSAAQAWIVAAIIWLAVAMSLTSEPAAEPRTAALGAAVGTCP